VFDLFRYLYNRDDHFVFSPDAKSDLRLQDLVSSLSNQFDNVYVVPAGLISWGGFSQVKSTMLGLAFAVQHLLGWTHFINLSGQHLPLHNADEIAEKLAPATSYIYAEAFDPRDTVRADDLMHRFNMLYEEVPGVGAFAKSDRTVGELLKTILYAGSNWVVLSKEICELLIRSQPAARLLGYFEDTLMPDETALQTIILGAGIGVHLPIENMPFTFDGGPGWGGFPDLTYTEKVFRDAQRMGYLFIRKRPKRLPDGIKNYLETSVVHTQNITFDVPLRATSVQVDDPQAEFVFHEVSNQLISYDPSLNIRQLKPNQVSCPRFYIQVRHSEVNDQLFVAALSENLVQFKVSLVWFDRSGGYSPKGLGGYQATVLKARVHDLAYNREVHVAEDTNKGFLSVKVPEELPIISDAVRAYLDVSKRLSSLIEAV